MWHVVHVLSRLLIGGADARAGASILLNVLLAAFVSPIHSIRLAKQTLTSMLRTGSACANRTGSRSHLVSHVGGTLRNDGSATRVEHFLGDILESPVDREAASTNVASGLVFRVGHFILVFARAHRGRHVT